MAGILELTHHMTHNVVAGTAIKNLFADFDLSGPAAGNTFIRSVSEQALEIEKLLNRYPDVPQLTERENFESVTRCWICSKEFKQGNVPVVDHCHYSEGGGRIVERPIRTHAILKISGKESKHVQ